jgi:hypothetical protein
MENEAEKLKMQREKNLENAHSNMKAQMEQLKQLKAETTLHQTTK